MRNNQTKTMKDEFKEASRAYSDASMFMHEAIARKAGLSGSDLKYLGLILQHREMTAGELSRLTGLTTGAVTGLIDRLENRQLLERRFTKADRRKVMIVPNVENSMALIQPLFRVLQQRTSEMLAGFSDSEIETILRYFVEGTAIMEEVTKQMNK